MSHKPLDLTQLYEYDLRQEIARRTLLRAQGCCDYCGEPHDSPPCEFPYRHRRLPSPSPDPSPDDRHPHDPLNRLVEWLSRRPLELASVAAQLRMPLPKCEGWGGECDELALWVTPAMTAYHWEGVGEDPNRPRLLCPYCSEEYRSYWQERWDEYYSGCL